MKSVSPEEILRGGWYKGAIYEDFSDYYKTATPDTIYRHKYGQLLGGHALEIVGYGEMILAGDSSPTKFWSIRNSWGTDVGGNNGYFKVVRGTNECMIEENVFACIPDIEGIKIVKYYPSVFGERDKELRDQFPVLPSGYPQSLAESLGLTNAPSYFLPKTYPTNFKAVLTGNLDMVGKIQNVNQPVDPDDLALIQELKKSGGGIPLREKKLTIGNILTTNVTGRKHSSVYFLVPLIIVGIIIIVMRYTVKKKES